MSHYNHDEPGPLGTIFSSERQSRTKRNLSVILDGCSFCGHHKAIQNDGFNAKVSQKCSRCKR